MARGKLYQRKTNSRKEKPLVLIVPEGAETEKVYLESIKEKIQARHLSGRTRRLWPDGIGVASILPLQTQKRTLPGLRLGRDDLHLRADNPPIGVPC